MNDNPNNPTGHEPINQKAQSSPRDTKSWFEYVWQEQQQTPNRLEDAAKFLATMISVTLTIFFTIGKTAFEQAAVPLILKISVVLWLAALLVAFLVLFPQRYAFVGKSANNIKEMHGKIVKKKYRLLSASVILFSIALILSGWYFFFSGTPAKSTVKKSDKTIQNPDSVVQTRPAVRKP